MPCAPTGARTNAPSRSGRTSRVLMFTSISSGGGGAISSSLTAMVAMYGGSRRRST